VKGASNSREAESKAVLREVALDARLAEGPEGVRKVLRAIYRSPRPISIGHLARCCQLPVPVTAAIRGELEKRRILSRKGGIVLTEEGSQLVRSQIGLHSVRQFSRTQHPALGEEFAVSLRRMESFCDDRPGVDVKLDQSHATAETALRRAVYLFEHDAIEDRDILILGDDDLTSLAIDLVSEYLDVQARSILVIECDRRLVDFLDQSKGSDSVLSLLQHDLRESLPENFKGGFDVFITDPPYTIEGLRLFVSRGVEALRPDVGKQGFICFGNRTPSDMCKAIGSLVDMGLAPVEIVPDFNQYVGAQVLAGVSQMIRTVSTHDLRPEILGEYSGSLYTADRKRHASSSAT